MKESIRNRKVVATVMTQTALSGQRPDAKFTKKVGSRLLFYNYEKLAINCQNKKTPPAKFSRVDLGQGAFVWAPTNKSGEAYLASLTPEERDKFLYHVPEKSDEPKPESRRVVDGRPIKALPNGHRESDYFPSTGSPRKAAGSRAPSNDNGRVTSEPIPEEIDRIRELISQGKF